MTEENPHAERLLKLRQAVAKEYGIGDTGDWRVRRLALMLSMHAAAEDQSAGGDPVDVGNLLALDKAIEDVRQSLKVAEPLDISVRVVQRVTGICPLCKGEVKDYTPPPKPPAPPPTVEPEAPPVVVKAPTAPAARCNVVPLVASGVSPLSFGGGYDPARHYGSGLSRDPNPYRRDTGQ
jgi:hypothetical protein